MLNKIEPNMEPCGTPYNRILRILSASFILIFVKMLKLQWLTHMHDEALQLVSHE